MSAETTFSVLMTKLISRKEVAERTMAFRFEKPKEFTFRAGQFMEVALINPPENDERGNTHAFSIASAPSEDFLMVATRLRESAYKRVLSGLTPGTEVKIEGPFGDLALHNNAKRPAVLLSGGIGITPFRSILIRAAKEKLPHRIYFFYANRRPEDAPFLAEVAELELENPNFKFIPTMTKMSESHRPWNGEQGYINREMLEKYLAGVENAIYYLTGPAGMVHGLRKALNETGVDDDDIRTEEFEGY